MILTDTDMAWIEAWLGKNPDFKAPASNQIAWVDGFRVKASELKSLTYQMAYCLLYFEGLEPS